MKNFKQLSLIVALVLIGFGAFAQEAEKEKAWYEKGTLSGTIFANAHTMVIDEFGDNSAFEVDRAYFGYKYKIDDHFVTNVLLDIHKDADLGRRTAFFKNAYVEYNYDKLKVQMGIAGNFQFSTQEKFFGYRYVVKSFQDQNKFGPSADLGVFAYYKASDALTINLSVNNGEGYGVEQDGTTNNFKTQLGLVITPGDIFTVSLYGDAKSFSDSSQITLSGFVGANLNPVKLGVEFVNQSNHDLDKDHNYMGLSAFAKFKASDKVNVFVRYDMVRSDEIADTPWNIKKDGDFIVGGVEYIATKNISFAADYQHQMYELEGADAKGFLFLHMQAKF